MFRIVSVNKAWVGTQVFHDGDLGEVLFGYEVGGDLMYLVRFHDRIEILNGWDLRDASDCVIGGDDFCDIADLLGEDEEFVSDMVADMGYTVV